MSLQERDINPGKIIYSLGELIKSTKEPLIIDSSSVNTHTFCWYIGGVKHLREINPDEPEREIYYTANICNLLERNPSRFYTCEEVLKEFRRKVEHVNKVFGFIRKDNSDRSKRNKMHFNTLKVKYQKLDDLLKERIDYESLNNNGYLQILDIINFLTENFDLKKESIFESEETMKIKRR